MMKLVCALFSLCFATMILSLASAGERWYDFSDDSAWEPITADWEIIDGEYVNVGSTDSELGMAVLKETEEVDTEDVESVEVMGYDLGSGGWQNLFLIFGFDESQPLSYLAGPFVGGAQEWRIETFDSQNRGGRASVAGAADVLSPKTWYHVKLVFEGDTGVLYGAEEDGDLEEKLRYDFPGGKPFGRVGLGGSNCDNKFDDFKVTGPGILGFAVEPEDKLAAAWGKIKINSGL